MNATTLFILLCIYAKNKIPYAINSDQERETIEELKSNGLIEGYYEITFKGIDFLTKLSKAFNSKTI